MIYFQNAAFYRTKNFKASVRNGWCFLCAPKRREVLLLYPVSEAFQQTVQENTRRFFWTGRITTKSGLVHAFGNEDIVKGSGYISSQCCGSTEIEIGTVYVSNPGLITPLVRTMETAVPI